MADDKAVGPLASAKLVTLIKTALKGKYGKTGGKIDGSAEITGSLKVGMSAEFNSSINAQNYIQSDLLVMTPSIALYDGAKDAEVAIGVARDNVATVTKSVSGGGTQYARLAVGTPTGDNDAATKAYVDSKIAAGGVTVDDALSATSTNPVQNKAVKAALDEKMDKSGGTLTGNLTGQYFIGTWLQTTAAGDLGRTPGKIAVLDDAGWVYYRTPAELLADIGAATVSTIMDKVYPVGAIYISANSTNPKTLFGVGTWTQIKDTFLLAAGSTYKAGTTGGEAEHTLTAEELPTHQHPIWAPNASGEANAAIGFPMTGSKNTYYAEASKTGGAGGGKAHNNMPPYLAVYVWRRTA